jgi:hypothetical protein
MNGFHKPVTCVNGRTDAFARVVDCQMIHSKPNVDMTFVLKTTYGGFVSFHQS